MGDWNSFKLGEIAKISAGGDVPKKAFSKDKTPEFSLPIISNGVGDDAVYGYTNIEKISDPCITIAARGTIGYTAFHKDPFYPVIRLICVVPDQKIIIPKFLYYQIASMKLTGTSGGIPQLTLPMVSKCKVRVPDLQTQQKVVQILDTWDQSINAVIKYKHAQGTLLKYLSSALVTGEKQLGASTADFKHERLGDVAVIERGRILTAKNAISGDVPVIAGGIDSPYTHSSYTHKNVITVSASGANAGYVAYRPGKIWASDCNVVYGKDNVSNTLFLFYWMTLLQNRIYQLQTGGAQPHVHSKDLAKLGILLPSIDIQNKVVECILSQVARIEYLKKYEDSLERQKNYLLNHLISGDFDLSKIKLEKEEQK